MTVVGGATESLGHHSGCVSIECARIDGRPTAFTGGTDGVVRVWDLLGRRMVDVIEVGGEVWHVEVVAGRTLMIGVGGELLAMDHVSTVPIDQ
jgi:hypothetical protein